jgi:hypothetical protein
MDQACLAAAIGDAARARVQTSDRGDIDDSAPFIALESWRKRSGEQEGAPKVGFQHSVPRLAVKLIEIWERDADVPASVVDEHIASAVSIDDRCCRFCDRELVSLVEVDRARLASDVLDGGGGRFSSLKITNIGDRDIATSSRESLGDGTTDVA